MWKRARQLWVVCSEKESRGGSGRGGREWEGEGGWEAMDGMQSEQSEGKPTGEGVHPH